MKNYRNYLTYYTGTPKKLENCPIIYYYRTSSLDFDLSLSTLDKLKNTLEKEKSNLIWSTKNSDGMYDLDLETLELKNFSFDLIIYCSYELNFDSNENSILGYTVFSELQRIYTTVGNPFTRLLISLTINQGKDSGSEAIITILNTYKVNQLTTDLSGNNNYNYPLTVRTPQYSYVRYSNKLSDIKNDPTLVSVTDSGIVYNGGNSYSKFFVRQGIQAETDLYTHFYLGVYNNDLVICRFSLDTGNYSVISLTKQNVFKKPFEYFSGSLDKEVYSDHEILGFSHSCLVFWYEEDQSYLVYTLDENKTLRYPRTEKDTGNEYYLVTDYLDPQGKYKYLSASDLFTEIKNTCITPMNGSSIDLDKNNYTFKRKIGSWWELLRDNNIYYYLSPHGCISSTHTLEIINDRLFKTQTGIIFPIEFGHIYTYNPNSSEYPQESGSHVGFKINPTRQWDVLNSIQLCLLDGLRRRPRRTKTCFPQQSSILGTIFGLIFYIEDGLIYCY